MSQHEITVELTVELTVDVDGDEWENAYPEVEITFDFTCGERERGPSYYSGGEPATGHEVDFVSCKVIDASALNLSQNAWDDLAIAYLKTNAGRERAIQEATDV